VSTQTKTLLTPDQYLEIERQAPYKSEYWQGVMFAMAGASRQHDVLAGNLFASLHQQFRGRPCEVYKSDMRVYLPATGLYTYPDVVAVCGPGAFADDHVDTLINPSFLAEVLSPSTEAYDRGRKSEHYRTMESLQEYLLIAQDRIHVELYTRQQDGTWLLREANQLQDIVQLRSIGCHIHLLELHEKIHEG